MAPEIDGKVYITEIEGATEDSMPAPGTLATVEIIDAQDYDLVGRILDSALVPDQLNNEPMARSAIGTGHFALVGWLAARSLPL